MNRQGEIFARLAQAALIAVVRAEQPEHAVRVTGALLAGGIQAVELTFTTPGAAEALAAARQTYGDAVLLGAGTIREPAQVTASVQAGVDFLVSAHLRADLLQAMLATGLPALPGVFTPSEVAQALEAGAEVVKLFPASTAGPGHLRALRGPFPGLQVVPTGGIDIEDLPRWFAVGALAIGVGSELVPRSLMQEGRWDEITSRAMRFAAAARSARAQ
ncbi:bifunctional 4-hydroxy-2-oxoglutarate aldolase/2-dehydro-3-deoxy-phosphogluconate aldolase [Thermogemmatispora carboxidivorans]|uniref:bifunctional 4-hydroxy-2-oxoglutarate aldolase/2-dehydro-3-deoxy-phosphogluconate aldolase n=1 Tax=Thermogemmatispora carboxidivorans TaxID=1382306 RepID=UPI00069C37F7|nr:bifunctional 4-hydroxy-2-oxoglutarate aldolase/2-dehydro-3-deoxy-phosphogluconate aldolase [Thermogemmatispora carboxidivorans]